MGEHRHGHAHDHSGKRLGLAVLFTLGFAGVEVVGGLWANSLALISDAGHMLTDASALGLAALAAWLAHRPASKRHSYGLGRVEILAALVNALVMIALVAGIAASAIGRLLDPRPVTGQAVMIVAAIGLVVNIIVAWMLMGDRENINVRGALLHVMGDLLGSVAALISGVVIIFTGWTPVDPLLAMLIAALILVSSLRLLRVSLHSLLDGVPFYLDLESVRSALTDVDGVREVFDLHIWQLSAGRVALSAHVRVDDVSEWPALARRLTQLAGEDFGIDHVTLQPHNGEHTARGCDT
ncbi:MAG: cation diffusion facilitator family transporter [Gammaproteobacteria bacterium]|nr:cation diffusion facilitator family transporter [Gammaproteobacteria bacterium]MDX5503670.1 cation diffusion facilitator family transporter [Halomonas sp.]